jgi:hypothetical protein
MAVVTITATGLNIATAPNNFTISIVNYQNTVTQYATGVSRASLISGYNVTVNPGDSYVRATSTGTCTYSTDIDISSAALQTYRPDPVSADYDVPSYPYGFARITSDIYVVVGTFTTYAAVALSDLQVTHTSTTGSFGGAQTYGPLVDENTVSGQLTLEQITPGNFRIIGYSRSMATDASLNNSSYKITYLPNGLSRNFTFYWVVDV